MKRRETDPASNQLPKCSPPSGTHRNSQSWVQQRGVKEEKFLHSEGHPERFTELHGEEKREEGVRGDLNEVR